MLLSQAVKVMPVVLDMARIVMAGEVVQVLLDKMLQPFSLVTAGLD